MNVGQIYGDGNDILHFIARGFEHFRNIVERRFGLRANASGCQLACIVGSFLPRNVQRVAGDDFVAEGEPSCRRQIDGLVFLSVADLGWTTVMNASPSSTVKNRELFDCIVLISFLRR